MRCSDRGSSECWPSSVIPSSIGESLLDDSSTFLPPHRPRPPTGPPSCRANNTGISASPIDKVLLPPSLSPRPKANIGEDTLHTYKPARGCSDRAHRTTPRAGVQLNLRRWLRTLPWMKERMGSLWPVDVERSLASPDSGGWPVGRRGVGVGGARTGTGCASSRQPHQRPRREAERGRMERSDMAADVWHCEQSESAMHSYES